MTKPFDLRPGAINFVSAAELDALPILDNTEPRDLLARRLADEAKCMRDGKTSMLHRVA